MVSNWGRWGEADERGAFNLLTPEHVLGALRGAARTGRIYSLAQPLRMSGVPMSDSGGTPIHVMARDAGDYTNGVAETRHGTCHAEDYLTVRMHANTTHIDALGHVWKGDTIYNGHPAAGIGSMGMTRCGIDNLPALVTRGLLLDVAGGLGLAHLDPSHEITAAELQESARAAGVEVRTGDVVLVRTGWPAMYFKDRACYQSAAPGIGLGAASWLSERDVVAVGSDTLGVEVRPYAAGTASPVHVHLLQEHGTYMIELLDLEEVAADGVHEFLFVAAPLRLTGGTASPLNPIAIA
jgi:kynurenine formamidase